MYQTCNNRVEARNINKLSVPERRQSSAEMCQGCQQPIRDKYLLNSLGSSWHEDCLKCACCEARLGEVADTLFTRANLILCKRDYLRLFGSTGHCAACNKPIPAFEMVMRAKHNVYHLECFACQLCGHRFCVGDRFYLSDNKVLCEADYADKMSSLQDSTYDNRLQRAVESSRQSAIQRFSTSADMNNNGPKRVAV